MSIYINGVEQITRILGPLDIDSGLLYLGATTTPDLGEHDEHGVFYSKADTLPYFLYDKAGEVEYLLALALAWGTFTPTVTLVGGAGNTVPVYTTNTGRYTVIGKLCFVEVFLDGDGGDEGAGTGVINIALPIPCGASAVGNGIGTIGIAINGAGENYILYGEIAQGVSVIQLHRWTSIKVLADLMGDDQDDVGRCINLHFWYEID